MHSWPNGYGHLKTYHSAYGAMTTRSLYGLTSTGQLEQRRAETSFFVNNLAINHSFYQCSVEMVNGQKKWRWTPSGDFSCASPYRMMHNGGILSLTQKHLWKIKVPQKVRVFVWLMLDGKILTKQTLLTRGGTIQTGCHLCEADLIETRDHIMWNCGYLVRFWWEFFDTLQHL